MQPGDIVWGEDRNGGHYGIFIERINETALVAFGTSTVERFDSDEQRQRETLLVLDDPRVLRNYPPLRTTTYFYKRWLGHAPLERLQRSHEWGRCQGLKFQKLSEGVHAAMLSRALMPVVEPKLMPAPDVGRRRLRDARKT